MDNTTIEAVTKRLMALPKDREQTVIWRTIGGCQWLAVNKPNARISEFFSVLEENVAEQEKKISAAAA